MLKFTAYIFWLFSTVQSIMECIESWNSVTVPFTALQNKCRSTIRLKNRQGRYLIHSLLSGRKILIIAIWLNVESHTHHRNNSGHLSTGEPFNSLVSLANDFDNDWWAPCTNLLKKQWKNRELHNQQSTAHFQLTWVSEFYSAAKKTRIINEKKLLIYLLVPHHTT